jgi:glycosyltransferase involved in cell wall biosynthesis
MDRLGAGRGPCTGAFVRRPVSGQVTHARITPVVDHPDFAASPDEQTFRPIPVGDVELADPLSLDRVQRNAAGEAVVLVRLHKVPLGVLHLVGASASRVDLRERLQGEYAAAVLDHLAGDGLSTTEVSGALALAADLPCSQAPAPSPGLATVVVCTLGADPRLRQTVDSILAQSHAEFELLVVDNRPESGGVDSILAGVADPRLRILRQPRRGLSAARNAGLAAAQGDVTAFTDDDAYADPDWLARLLTPFCRSPAVACTTGLVLPAALDTPAQLLFEEFGGFAKGFEPVVWSAADGPDGASDGLGRPGVRGALFPYSAGVFGSGNNMAVRTAWARHHGLFDEALGAGTVTRGGEDLDAFLTVMMAGDLLVYEPRAIVHHHARADSDSLRQQLYGYGSGMSAVIVKHALTSPRRALAIAARLPAGLVKLLSPSSEKNAARSADFPPELTRAELKGYLAGPVLYLRARSRARRAIVAGGAKPSPR